MLMMMMVMVIVREIIDNNYDGDKKYIIYFSLRKFYVYMYRTYSIGERQDWWYPHQYDIYVNL